MGDFCDYCNPEWRKRFDGLRNGCLKTKIEGNTYYIIRENVDCDPVYEKIIGNLYKKVGTKKQFRERSVCMLIMCKLKESTLTNVLESYGFEVDSL